MRRGLVDDAVGRSAKDLSGIEAAGKKKGRPRQGGLSQSLDGSLEAYAESMA